MATDTIELRVDGMTCGSCEQRVTKALSRIDGVRNASADHAAGRVRVLFDPDRVASAQISAQIVTAGYRVEDEETS